MTRSPRRLKKNVQDTVGEHVRDLPIQAARLAMFGVGRALLLSDRLTKDYKELRESGPRPVLNRLRGDAQHLAGQVVTQVTERVSERLSGPPPRNAQRPAPRSAARPRGGTTRPTEPETPVARPPKVNRRLSAEPEIAVGKPAAARRPASRATAKTTTSAKAAPKTAPRAASKTAAARPAPARKKISAASLPVPNYDQATLASLRARLRGLSAAQVGLLHNYEQENAGRPEVLRMYENRIAKLTAGR
jgi:hypothetical protein